MRIKPRVMIFGPTTNVTFLFSIKLRSDLRNLRSKTPTSRQTNKCCLLLVLETQMKLDQVGEADDLSFSSVLEAVQTAADQCKNLELLDSATLAAAASPFQRPYDIFKALTDLDDIVDAWAKNRENKGSGGDLLQHLRDRGWGKRSSMHISDTTRGKYRSHYEFSYQGRKQLFEPHITIGAGDPNSCASIHFIFDQERLRMIIGHVGKHLPNTKT